MIKFTLRVACLLVSLCLLLPQQSSLAEDLKPKIGLALAGGGALGFAHVGVLKVLEEQRVPVHIVTGTSMGAIVGAAYASGRSIAELEKVLSETDWDKLFDESSVRREVPYRFKAGRERELYGDVKIAFDDNGLVLPAGIIQGQYVVPVLQRLYENVPSPAKFDELPIPFRAVTADIETGEPFIPTEGDLATIVRASMSVPAVFAPVSFGDKLLVDGGIANNLPIDQVFKLGATQVIAVELYADLKKRADINASPLAITGQIISILLAQNSAIQRQLLRPSDILIAPDLKGYSSTDFAKAKELMAIGEAAARKSIPQLKRFSISEEAYKKYNSSRYRSIKQTQMIDFIEVKDNSSIPADKLIKDFGIKEGDVFDRGKIEEAMQGLYSTGQYRSVNYNYIEKDGKKGVVLDAQKKEWFDRFARIGASIEDDFEGSSNYRLGADYKISSIGEAGATLDIDGEIGRSPNLALEYYRPFSSGSSFFLAPKVQIGRYSLDVRNQGDVLARYLRTTGNAALRIGSELGRSGEASVGILRGFGELERDIGAPELPEFSYDVGEAFAKIIVDDLDAPDFPKEGVLARLAFRSSQQDLGSTEDFNDLATSLTLPYTFGRNTIIFKGDFANTFEDRPVERSYSLGGFFNISGYEQQSLLASDYYIGQAIFFHRFSELKLPLFGFDFFAGGTFEYASLRSDVQQISDNPSIVAGSAFIGADTPLLPAYVGFGINDEDEHSIYIAIGRLSAQRLQ